MLFNSYPFLFVFLPIALAGFFLIGSKNGAWATGWLAAASLAFYAWWNPIYVLLLLASIVFNFVVGLAIVRETHAARKRRLLGFGVAADLLLLGYYKYADFFVANLNHLNAGLPLPHVVLPLGISFFTFTQIAFLADAYHGRAAEYRFAHYCAFVSYFPHLIAGPVLHHGEMIPQLGRAETYRWNWENMAVGLTIFSIGLFKKTVIADGIAVYVSPVFDAPAPGTPLGAAEAWGGALAFTFQLYFDFSGYSDMAIGLSRLFGVWLPLNFNSPYKAASIIDFWRRWHMTLSRFLRDYLYVPLGGNRRGATRRYLNLMITMLLGGLWHGASWTFVAWGGLHGLYLLVNHAWRGLRERLGWRPAAGRAARIGAVLVTFLATVVAWVFFRSDTIERAWSILQAMVGFNGLILPSRWLERLGAAGAWLAQHGVRFENAPAFGGGTQVNWIIVCALIAFLAPNTQEILRAYRPALAVQSGVAAWWRWRPAPAWLALAILAAALAVLSLTSPTEFLYFRF